MARLIQTRTAPRWVSYSWPQWVYSNYREEIWNSVMTHGDRQSDHAFQPVWTSTRRNLIKLKYECLWYKWLPEGKLKKFESFTQINYFLCTELTLYSHSFTKEVKRFFIFQAHSVFLNKIEMKWPCELLTDVNRELARYFKHFYLFFLHEFPNCDCKICLLTSFIF